MPAFKIVVAAVLNTVSVRPVNHLSEAVEYLNGRSDLPIFKSDPDSVWNTGALEDLGFEDVKGQEHAKRGPEVAAAGSHAVLMLSDIGHALSGCRLGR